MDKELTDAEFAELMEKYNELVLKKQLQPYDPFPMGKWWYLFAFAFCLVGAVSYMSVWDIFSAMYLAFMSGMNLMVYLLKCDGDE